MQLIPSVAVNLFRVLAVLEHVEVTLLRDSWNSNPCVVWLPDLKTSVRVKTPDFLIFNYQMSVATSQVAMSMECRAIAEKIRTVNQNNGVIKPDFTSTNLASNGRAPALHTDKVSVPQFPEVYPKTRFLVNKTGISYREQWEFQNLMTNLLLHRLSIPFPRTLVQESHKNDLVDAASDIRRKR